MEATCEFFTIESPAKMFKRIENSEVYASTKNADSGKEYMDWGTLDEDNVFIPNDLFLALPEEFQKAFYFPRNWDLRNVEHLKGNIIEESTSSRVTSTKVLHDMDLDDFKFIVGGYHLLMTIFGKNNIHDNLKEVFDYCNDFLAACVMYISVNIELINLSYAPWLECRDKGKVSSAAIINSFFKRVNIDKIKDEHRVRFIKSRLQSENYFKLDTAFVAFYTEVKLFDYKETDEDYTKSNTLVEAIAYFEDKYEPFYYRIFAGNEINLKIINSVKSDLNKLGIDDVKFMIDTDDSYSYDIISKLIYEDIPFIAVQKSISREIYSHISEIKYDESKNPIDMQYSDKNKSYYKQIDLSGKEYKLSDGETYTANDYKFNICVKPSERLSRLEAIDSKILEETKLLNEKISSDKLKDEYEEISEGLVYYKIIAKDPDNVKIILNNSRIKKDKDLAGISVLFINQIDGDVEYVNKLCQLKLDQDSFFNNIRKIFDEGRDDYEYKNISEVAQDFVLFFALFLHIKLSYGLRSSEKLKSRYTLTSLVNEMRSFELIESYSQHEFFEGLNKSQREIFKELGLAFKDFTAALIRFGSEFLNKKFSG